jgi:hypothetical protein
VKIPDSEIDQELHGKLMAEAEGILAWLVVSLSIFERFPGGLVASHDRSPASGFF